MTACSSLVCMRALYTQANKRACIFILFFPVGQAPFLSDLHAHRPNRVSLQAEVTGGIKVAEMRSKLPFSTGS